MTESDRQSITYESTGVNYGDMDPFKRNAQKHAIETSGNLERFGFKAVEKSRGESAFVWDEGDSYKAMVIEGVGTKTLVADEMRNITGKTYYDQAAQDTIAMIVNDLIVVGADPMVIEAYVASGSSEWFKDEERREELNRGWKDATNAVGAAWGGGESPALKGMVNPDSGELAGAAVGIIKPKERLTLGDKLKAGDAIFGVESSGIHANGLTLARTVASELPEGYATQLSSGKMYGEALLTPTNLYAGLVRDLFEEGIDIHYMVNVTGHGWRKLMRAEQEFSYVIENVPKPQEEFDLIQEISRNDDEEMYGNLNMGLGFAIFMPPEDVEKAQLIAQERYGLKSGAIGHVEEGPKKVEIRPKGITFEKESLEVR